MAGTPLLERAGRGVRPTAAGRLLTGYAAAIGQPEVERAEARPGDRRTSRARAGIHLVHLRDDPYRAVLPKGHPLAAKRVLDLADLAAEPWVDCEGPAGPCREIVRDACAAAGFTPSVAVESDDYATAQGFVAAGLGVALMPETGLGNRHPSVVARRLRRPEPSRSIHAAVRESTLDQPALRALLDAFTAPPA